MISNKIIAKEFFMELVYLWVEDYKNIQKQGFNFSSRFRCEYDEKTEKLEIIDKDKTDEFYPKNFFDGNINVTAIVGENGSGKSGILNCIYNKRGKIFAINNGITELDTSEKILISNYTKNDLAILSMAYNLRKLKFFQEKFLPNALEIKVKNIKVELSRLNITEYVEHYTSDNPELADTIRGGETYWTEYYTIYQIEENLKSTYNKIVWDKDIINILYFHLFYEDLEKACNNPAYFENDELREFLSKSLLVSYSDFITELKSFINKKYESFEKEVNFFEQLNIKKYEYSDIELKNLSYIEAIDAKYSGVIYLELDSIMEKNLENKYLKYLNLSFLQIKENRLLKFDDLSRGEQEILEIYSMIYSKLKNIKIKDIILLLDEPVVYWHPLWQKNFIKDLISFYKNVFNSFKIYTIITSHSPFIISDLPKENVIFLEKGKQVYPFENEQTFGANIHTLLSHGFFMKDGLMGEFAKDKIDTAIKYLNQSKLSDDELSYCENIISIIGEPIIKRELQRKLDSKRLLKLDKIDEIEEQMKLLAHRLESIRKNQK